MNVRAIEKTELNKILAIASEYAVLEGSRVRLKGQTPASTLSEVKKELAFTDEGLKLLFTHGVSRVEYFPPLSDELARAKKRSSLSCGELLTVSALLRSVRIAHTSITGVNDEEVRLMKELADKLYFDEALEEDITTKILNDSEVSDYASDKLYSLRCEIRALNERIRSRLAEYLTGSEGKYLQDAIVTMRDNRYVLPVRAEYKRNIKGFIHDKSSSGATFFIEPEEVLEMNNELRSLTIDEREEVDRILGELSRRVGMISDELSVGIGILEEIDCVYARAEYSYKLRGVKPAVNDLGKIVIKQGRHPLIDPKKVVPVTLSLGEEYRFLVLSGPNTGGKTVTLKMVGLFCMMAACGMFLPAVSAEVAVFEEIYCDIGDAQSIEENLSTFSSHLTNVIQITENANERSLVLIDELGGGTDPDEGQALAKAIVAYLLKKGASGVVTTHYTALKEFAYAENGIENACMEFDGNTLQPLYVIKIGLPGSSNALAISRRLGLQEEILQEALAGLSKEAQTFEHILRGAEESRIQAEREWKETSRLKAEWQEKLRVLEEEREKLKKEKEKLFVSAKTEAKKIINARTSEAEELLAEIEQIFAKEALSESDLISARTLKNKISNLAYMAEEEEVVRPQYEKVRAEQLKIGQKVYVESLKGEGSIQNLRLEKNEAEVLCGALKLRVKISELSVVVEEKIAQANDKKLPKWKRAKQAERVQVSKSLSPNPMPTMEIQLLGYTVHEALPEVEAFLDAAVIANLEEVRIVHGMGTGKLRAGIHEFLRTHKNVAEFRLGRYGEGETGVTIVKIK